MSASLFRRDSQMISAYRLDWASARRAAWVFFHWISEKVLAATMSMDAAHALMTEMRCRW